MKRRTIGLAILGFALVLGCGPAGPPCVPGFTNVLCHTCERYTRLPDSELKADGYSASLRRRGWTEGYGVAYCRDCKGRSCK